MIATESAPSDVFLLDKRHVPFYEGETGSLPANGKRAMLLFLAICLVFGLGFNRWLIKETLVFGQLRTDGQPALATVTALRPHQILYSTVYLVSYRIRTWQPTGWMTVNREERVSRAAFDALRPNGPVEVTYSLSKPHLVRAKAWIWQSLGMLLGFGILMVVVNAGLILLLVRNAIDLYRRLRISLYGQRLQGEVVNSVVEPDSDGEYWLQIDYRVQTPDGQVLEGSVTRTRNDLAGDPKLIPGTALAMLYLPPRTLKLL